MNTTEIQSLHKHPDGHNVFYDPHTQTLYMANGDDRQVVSIPMACFGLLELAEAAARISREILYGDDK